jgi:hypothetical protein
MILAQLHCRHWTSCTTTTCLTSRIATATADREAHAPTAGGGASARRRWQPPQPPQLATVLCSGAGPVPGVYARHPAPDTSACGAHMCVRAPLRSIDARIAPQPCRTAGGTATWRSIQLICMRQWAASAESSWWRLAFSGLLVDQRSQHVCAGAVRCSAVQCSTVQCSVLTSTGVTNSRRLHTR